MKRSNVVQFPTGSADNGGSLKGFAVIFYLSVALMMTVSFGFTRNGLLIAPFGIGPDGVNVLFLLSLAYTFFVQMQWQRTRYFKENKPLIIILAVLLAIAFQFLALMVGILALLYWLMIARHGKEAPYFLRFHLLTGLMVNGFILLPYLILDSLLRLLVAVLNLARLSAELAFILTPLKLSLPLVGTFLFWGMALWLSVSALMGRTPYIPLITASVRQRA